MTASMQQLLLELLPPPAASFDNFIPGQNAATLSALQYWLSDPKGTTCFLLWGETGSGRRHLLLASGAQQLPHATEEANQLAEVAHGTIFCKTLLTHPSMLEQIALFNAFNRLKQAGGKLLICTEQPPTALIGPDFREDLRTRLGSGLVYRLIALSDHEKRTALLDRAQALGLRLSTEAVEYIFRHARRDMGTLSALIDALNRFTLQHKRAVTLPLLRTLLQTYSNTSTP